MTHVSEDEIPERPFQNPAMQLKFNSYMPRHSAQLLVACCFFVALIFLPAGTAVILTSDSVYELEVRYDEINKCTINNHTNLSSAGGLSQGCLTRVPFDLNRELQPPLYLYYRIKGMHQNYREYSQSRYDLQALGEAETDLGYLSNCWPFRQPGEFSLGYSPNIPITVTGGELYMNQMVYNPCGTIAWSMFNDTFRLYRETTGSREIPVCIGDAFTNDSTPIALPTFDPVTFASNEQNYCSKRGITLAADLKQRYKAPARGPTQWTAYGDPNSNDTYLANGWYFQEPGHKVPLSTDEDYIVWARVAGMPDFWKLYRRIDTTLVPGRYIMEVHEFFDTVSFDGEKSFIIATTSVMGGKNYVLGGLLLGFGSLALVLALAFFLISIMKKPE